MLFCFHHARYTILGSNLKVCREIKKKREIKFVTGDFEVNFDWLVKINSNKRGVLGEACIYTSVSFTEGAT